MLAPNPPPRLSTPSFRTICVPIDQNAFWVAPGSSEMLLSSVLCLNYREYQGLTLGTQLLPNLTSTPTISFLLRFERSFIRTLMMSNGFVTPDAVIAVIESRKSLQHHFTDGEAESTYHLSLLTETSTHSPRFRCVLESSSQVRHLAARQ